MMTGFPGTFDDLSPDLFNSWSDSPSTDALKELDVGLGELWPTGSTELSFGNPLQISTAEEVSTFIICACHLDVQQSNRP